MFKTIVRSLHAVVFAIVVPTAVFSQTKAPGLPDGWFGMSPREEIRPAFAFRPKSGPAGVDVFLLSTDSEIGQQGWVQKAFPVVGGKTYRFHVQRRTTNVASPRRSTPVRIAWQGDKGKLVPADVTPGRDLGGRPIPTAEPEHPLDGETDKLGWTTLEARYRAPAKATRAIVELHLQWAPNAEALWTVPSFVECEPVSPRKIRLATIHYTPSGKSPLDNCREFGPLIAEAAKKGANLIVLGETVHYVGVRKKLHEVAESVPGPSTEIFSEFAKKHGVYIVVSLYEREGRAIYNVALLIGPDGRIIGRFRKVCLPHAEIEAGVMPGSDYPVFETKLGKIGLMVCYDGFFPEVARELTKRGAEVICWPVWGCDPLLARARANENRVFIVSSTYMDPKASWMLSAIYDRDGTPLAVADRKGAVAVTEVDLNDHRVGPYNLGAFHDMVQRHRPIPVVDTKPPGEAKAK